MDMNGSQRAFAAARLAMSSNGRSDTAALRAAAVKLGVSYGSAARARAVLVYGTKSDEDDIVVGRASLNKRAGELTRAKGVKATVKTVHSIVRPQLATVNIRPLSEVLPTREQVDPEFRGTATDWLDKYGHVQGRTAEQLATATFGTWASNIQQLAKLWRQMPEPRDADHNWLRSPKPYDVGRLASALELLRPVLTEAEALLATSEAALKKQAG